MNQKPPINKTYKLNIQQALGKLAEELNIEYIDYSTFQRLNFSKIKIRL